MSAAERALALDANLAEAHAVKARILSQYGRHDEASAELDIALRLDPESYEVNKSAAYLRVRQQPPGGSHSLLREGDGAHGDRRQFAGMLMTCYSASATSRTCARVAQLTLDRAEAILAQDANNGAAMGYGVTALVALGEVGSAPRNGSTAPC